jgi:hypothetical protein
MFARRPEGLRDITTGSFNLLSKIEIACFAETAKHFSRLSGAFSIRPNLPCGQSVRPRNSLKLSRLRKRCQPTEITGFPPDFNRSGSFDPERNAPALIKPGNLLLENSL